MRSRVVLVAAVLVPGIARADELSLHALLSTQAAATGTSFSDGTSSDPSVSYQLRPGFLFSYHSRRTVQDLTVEAGLDGTDFQTAGITLTLRGAWRATYSITPRTEAESGAGVTAGRVDALSTLQGASVGGPNVLPTGRVEFVGADGNESVSYQISPRMTGRENGFARYLQTTGGMTETRSYEVGGGLSGDRSFQVTAIGVETQASFQRLGQQDMGTPMMVFRDQLLLRGVLRLRRDFSPRWSGAVEGGVVTLLPLEDGEHRITEPTGSLEVAYFPIWGTATFQARHSVGPNLFLAQNEISDSAVINAALPLPWLARNRYNPTFTFLTSTGFAYTRFLSLATGDIVGRFTVLSADAALAWAPKPNLNIAARFQIVRQSDTEDSPDPMLMALGYTRNTFMLTFFGRWPERLAAEMPLRSRIRVQDVTPVGDDNTTGVGGELGGR